MKVFVGTPAHGPLEPESAYSFARLAAWLERTFGPEDVNWKWRIEARNPDQSLARNCIAHQFLESGFDVALLIDRDSVYTPTDATLLLDAGEDVVGAMCKMKVPDSPWVGTVLPGDVNAKRALVEMARIGFGMVSVSRHAMATLAAASERIIPQSGVCAGQAISRIFKPEVDPETLVPIGVDFAFCDRWRALGGRVWMHTEARIGHVGTHEFR